MISVVIPTFDRPQLLTCALASVAEQTYDDVEVIVINDGGTPLRHVVEPWRERMRIRLLELPRSIGPGAARNRGMDVANGEFIAFLDDDDVFLADHLALLAAAGEHHDFLYTGAVVSDRRTARLPADWTTLPRKAYPFSHGFLMVANYIHTGSIAVRNTEWFGNRFDEKLTQCEDWEMWLGLCSRPDVRVGHVPAITSVYHQITGERGKVTEGQLRSPTEFTMVRDRIYRRFDAVDDLVRIHRAWMAEFEKARDAVIADGGWVDAGAFDRALAYLYPRFIATQLPDERHIAELMAGDVLTVDR